MKGYSLLLAGALFTLPVGVNAQHHELFEECNYPLCSDEFLIDPLAEELVHVLENSLEKSFILDADINLELSGKSYNYDETFTEFSGSYNGGDMVLQKLGNMYHYKANGESLSISAEGNAEPRELLPFDFDATFNEEAILNFDTFQFAGKFDIESVDFHGNDTLTHVAEGILEVVELFEGKWITVDFQEIESEFPELSHYIQDLKADIFENDITEIYHVLACGISDLLLAGEIEVQKNGNTYTLSFPDSDLSLIVQTTYKGIISSIIIEGAFHDENEYDASYISFSPDVQIVFEYKTPYIAFPEITKDDWEITNIIEMVLEFEKDNILAEEKEDEYFYNLDVFDGNSAEAIEFLNTFGTETDQEFVISYVEQARVLDRRIRKKDIQVVADFYGQDLDEEDDWAVESIHRELMYSPHDDSEYRAYNQKYALEYALELIDNDRFEYGAYIPWEYYEASNLRLQTRGDVLVLLAKVRQSSLLTDAE